MEPNTIEETFEYRIKKAIAKTVKDTGAEMLDFKNTDDLLDYLHSDDIAQIFGKVIVDDMTEWTDNWI